MTEINQPEARRADGPKQAAHRDAQFYESLAIKLRKIGNYLTSSLRAQADLGQLNAQLVSLTLAADTLEGLAKEVRALALALAASPPISATGGADMRRVCEALGFDPDNHHNAAVCPYCTMNGAFVLVRAEDAALQSGGASAAITEDAADLIQACADQFREYERQHRAKGTPEADAKAEVNAAFARRCLAMLGARSAGASAAPEVGTNIVQAQRDWYAERLARVELVIDAFADIAMDPKLWQRLTDEAPSALVALELIDFIVDEKPPFATQINER